MTRNKMSRATLRARHEGELVSYSILCPRFIIGGDPAIELSFALLRIHSE